MKVQARITLPPDVRHAIDQVRMVYNPERAAGNPAHITVAYHDEAPNPVLLIERVRQAAYRIRPFHLKVGMAAQFPPPAIGAFLQVADPTGGVAAIRNVILATPFTRREQFGLHVTLLHPDYGGRLVEAWPAFTGLPLVGEFQVTEIQVVGPDNAVLAVFPLAREAVLEDFSNDQNNML